MGLVVSCGKMAKTIKVRVPRQKMHPKVGKLITLHKNYLVHDEAEQCVDGDLVRIENCRPLSARKRYTVTQVVKAMPTAPGFAIPDLHEVREKTAREK